MAEDRRDRRHSHDDAHALAAARSLRTAAALRDGGRRADAAWEGLALLRRMAHGAVRMADRLEDDGRGAIEAYGRATLLLAARDLERMASTAVGVEGRRADSGRVRTHALRADSPTTTKRRRRRRLPRRSR